MLDFSKDPFDLHHISIISNQLNYLTKDAESLLDTIIESAAQKSSHCQDFVQHVLSRCKIKNAVRALFSPTLFSTIIRVCEANDDLEIRGFYQEMFKLVTPFLETPIHFDYWSERTIDELMRIRMKADDIDEISKLMYSLNRIPIAFIVDKYIKGRPKEIWNYITCSTHIYTNSSCPLNIGGPVQNPEICDKVVKTLYRICNKLSRIVKRDLQRIYADLDWEAVNAQEGAAFTQSFITWLKWACAHFMYLGTRERNDGYPSWCFAPFSMDVCEEKEFTCRLGAFYDDVCDILSMDRDKDVSVQLKLYYDEDVIPDKYAFPAVYTDDSRYDPKIDEIAASFVGRHTVAKVDFLHVCQRLFWGAGAGVYENVRKECLIIPAGKGIEKYAMIRKV